MTLQEVVEKTVKNGGAIFRSGNKCLTTKDVNGLSSLLGPNFKHIVIGVYSKGCQDNWIWDDLKDAGYLRG